MFVLLECVVTEASTRLLPSSGGVVTTTVGRGGALGLAPVRDVSEGLMEGAAAVGTLAGARAAPCVESVTPNLCCCCGGAEVDALAASLPLARDALSLVRTLRTPETAPAATAVLAAEPSGSRGDGVRDNGRTPVALLALWASAPREEVRRANLTGSGGPRSAGAAAAFDVELFREAGWACRSVSVRDDDLRSRDPSLEESTAGCDGSWA